ncbi:MAG: ammonium transporter, partial [Alphaproteobacteria bacterium]|nr:ammonium transporter [Alphaproteobacteria bacterium]
ATFQGMFAVVTAAIITGAFAERVRLGPVLAFTIIWITVVYAPVAHWVWGGGWIAQLGALDFAGGAVVHINSGVAGLVAALVLGRRIRANRQEEVRPHNLPLTVLGASLLWFGWFGFNAGSALGANELAALAFANTNIAAAAGGFAWYAIELWHKNRSTALGIISGSVSGLVAITPAAGFVTPLSAIVIGLGGGLVCYLAVAIVKPKLGYDDSLDAFGIHGVGGLWGAIATGLFATTSVNPAGADGLFYGNAALLWAELIASAAVIAYSAIATYIVLKLLRIFVRMRVSKEEEAKGLDETQHGEVGYVLN